MHSYGMHWRAAQRPPHGLPFHDALSFLIYAHTLGATGVQVALSSNTPAEAKQLRAAAETRNMHFEGQLALPQDATASDLDRFKTELRLCREAGARVVRTVLSNGRRYETYTEAAQLEQLQRHARRSLELAAPVLKRERVRVAIENHKDWLVPELLALLKAFDDEWIGVCVDTGNSIALLEDPLEVVQAYAPYAASVHLKDMGVEPADTGFQLSEVPLGSGYLELRRTLDVLERANPRIQFNLEMITRDPLAVPCLTGNYWVTMGQRHARELARTLADVRAHPPRHPLPRVTGLDAAARLALEDRLVRESLAYARTSLGW
jgi:sugar phosphate isomerase/epimerase